LKEVTIMDDKCRHRKSWIMCSGWLEWCYECGAVRQLEQIEGTNGSRTKSGWIKSVGKGGENPYKKLVS